MLSSGSNPELWSARLLMVSPCALGFHTTWWPQGIQMPAWGPRAPKVTITREPGADCIASVTKLCSSHGMASTVVRSTPSWEECLRHLVGRARGQNMLWPSAPVLSLTSPFCRGYFSHPIPWTLAPDSLRSGSLLSSHSPGRLPQNQRDQSETTLQVC